ncbi:hypothetical protein [Nitrosomonas oligotropha]|uniref:hypothetical protein n=1 Tax=Nitrosomonas oligotropha TaxID=42354 RepID=UPI00136E372B|nr:hypothetical protein [Nitrosomonas oligotropha]MXS82775.1 hypothetical protein [Nitrosomonas oligotropha]
MKREFRKPVSWLGGRDLLTSLKSIISSTVNGEKQDSRDWMFAETISMKRCTGNQQEPYWFDYIADTGDGMSAVYNVAYLCMSDLWLKSEVPGKDQISLSPTEGYDLQLPRGEFLFVGGDTAYHVADVASLKERFQTPFNWAYVDICAATGKKVEQRPIFGIPANHDYYDALDGFNRQFCEPISKNLQVHVPEQEDLQDPQLGLYGFTRMQKSSYVALELPFDWKLWGFDAQKGKMDKRQQAFFVSTFCKDRVINDGLFDEQKQEDVQKALRAAIPGKLIVATPEPSTVFGKPAAEDAPMTKSFEHLGLEPVFLHDGKLSSNKCRLDISGDTHHYARYWGYKNENGEPGNYASVVAGGGGAFLHPSHTDVGEIKKQQTYPAELDSHCEITQRILNPWNILWRGSVGLIGALVALVTYFAVTIPQSTSSLFRYFLDNLPDLDADQYFLERIQQALFTADTHRYFELSYGFDLVYIFLFIVFLLAWKRISVPELSKVKYSDSQDEWERFRAAFLVPVSLWIIPLLFLVLWPRESSPASFQASWLIGLFVLAALLIFDLSRGYSDVLSERSKIRHQTSGDSLPLWVLNVMGIVCIAFGFLHYGVYKASVMSFDLLAIILWSLVIAGFTAFPFFDTDKLGIAKTKRGKFLAIGFWHALLQISIPVCLALYVSLTEWLVICTVTIAITVAAGFLFTNERLTKNFSPEIQEKIGNGMLMAWVVIGMAVFFSATRGEPIPVDGWRLIIALLSGAIFSCIWLGWYFAVSLAFNCHNGEAGGGARSERYRHIIRFKLTENTLTGYVIGIDTPMTDLKTQPPKFRLVDVFTLQAKNK